MELSEMYYPGYCKKCKQPLTYYGKDVNTYIECPSCHTLIYVDKDDFLKTYNHIKRLFKD